MVKYCVKKNHTVVLKLESIVTKCHRFTTIDKWRLMGFEPMTLAPQVCARPLCYNCRQDCQMLFLQDIDLLIQREFFQCIKSRYKSWSRQRSFRPNTQPTKSTQSGWSSKSFPAQKIFIDKVADPIRFEPNRNWATAEMLLQHFFLILILIGCCCAKIATITLGGCMHSLPEPCMFALLANIK